MTLLSNEDIRASLAESDIDKRLVITPLLDADAQIGPASVDVRLGTEFLQLKRTSEAGLDPRGHLQEQVDEMFEPLTVPFGGGLWLQPRHFLLAATLEYIRLPADIGAYVVGRSSWGRVGLIVATAVMAHPGFTGCLTLELVNEGDSPIRLYPGVSIAQLAFHRLAQPTALSYGTGIDEKYLGPIGPEASRLAKEKVRIEEVANFADRFSKRLS